MSLNPVTSIRQRVARSIDWRVARALDEQLAANDLPADAGARLDLVEARVAMCVEELSTLHTTLASVAASLTDQDRALAQLIEQLDRRVASIGT